MFQSFNLLGSLTAAQNVALPSRLAGRRLSRGAVQEALAGVGLGERARTARRRCPAASSSAWRSPARW